MISTGQPRFEAFFGALRREVLALPRTLLLYTAAFVLCSAALDIQRWANGPTLTKVDYLGLGLAVIVWFGLIYSGIAALMNHPRSLASLLRYLATSIALAAPAVAMIGLVIWSMWTGDFAVTGLAALVLGLASLFLLPQLVAWPVLQAVSSKVVSPVRVFRAMRGLRAELILGGAGFAGARSLPDVAEANSLGEAAASAVVSAAVGGALTLLSICVAVVAARYAVERDPGLAPQVA